jgi:hypothetical protein
MQTQKYLIASKTNQYTTFEWDDCEDLPMEKYMVFQDQIDSAGTIRIYSTFEELCSAYIAGEIHMS